MSKGLWKYAEEAPSKLSLVDPDGRHWSRAELVSEVNRTTHGLRALGLAPGDSVAICSPNCAEYYLIHFACQQSGLYLTPINWHLSPPEIAYIVEDSEAKAFVGHARIEANAAVAEQISVPPQARIAVGGLEGFRDFAGLTEDQPDTRPDERTAGNVMNYTSGTTGNPKGVRRPLPGVDPDQLAGAMTGLLMLFGIQPEADNVHLVGSPLYHTAVIMWSQASFHHGHTVVLMDKWLPEPCLHLIDRHRVTTTHMVPTQFHRMLGLPEEVRARYDCSSTRHMVHAAAPCPPEVKRRMIEWWGESIWEYYAATEGGGTMVSPREWLEHPGTVGRPWPGADVRVFDEEGREVPREERGTIYFKVPDTGDFEYKGDRAKTRKNRLRCEAGEFFTVGDVGYFDADGYLFLSDRKIDMIISGGANIYPAEIENVLLSHPKVGDAAVFGIPHEDWGEEVKAVVEPATGVQPGDPLTDELMAFVGDRLAKFKWPRSIDYTDALPRDPNGKLYKRRLRDPYWEGRERRI
ncbi:MAG: acyl-CoA synthetase [Proteobacteria bacterium]|nr:acyl-CoA synthetase [Pseudomonadota bacterium]